jgi:aerobic carbon-monoxide dehydrogenase medium subunit
VGGAGGVPTRAVTAERVLADGGTAADAAAAAGDALEPTGDLHGSPRYRRALAVEMIRRALVQARVGGAG